MGIKAPLVKIYDTAKDRMDTALGNKISNDKIRMWQCIRVARNDYEKNECHGYYEPTTEKFIKWLAENWGIKIHLAQDGYNLSHQFDIIAEDKYTMFMLKYS